MDMYLFEKPYLTINGEAEHIGKACVFVRFQGCKVGCHWCDAMGTWPKKSGDKFIGIKMNNLELMNYLDENFPLTKRIWITGGEPTEHCDEVRDFIQFYREHSNVDRIWHLITAGEIYDEWMLRCFDKITIDVKPPSSKAKKSCTNNSFIELCMENMVLQDRVEFKMVVSNDKEDIDFAKDKIARLAKYHCDITLQPLYWSEAEVKIEESKAQALKSLKGYQENFALPKNWKSYAEFAEYFMDILEYENVRVLPQLHKIYWPGEMNGI